MKRVAICFLLAGMYFMSGAQGGDTLAMDKEKYLRQIFLENETKLKQQGGLIKRFNEEDRVKLGFVLNTLFDITQGNVENMYVCSSNSVGDVEGYVVEDTQQIWNYDLFDALLRKREDGSYTSKAGENTTITIRFNKTYYQSQDNKKDRSVLYRDNSIILFLRLLGADEDTWYMRVSVMIPNFSNSDHNPYAASDSKPKAVSFVLAFDEGEPSSKLLEFQNVFDSLLAKTERGEMLSKDEEIIMNAWNQSESVVYNYGYAKWLFGQQRYFDALTVFKKVFEELNPQMVGHQLQTDELFFETCYHIGSCYNELELFEKAFYYLSAIVDSSYGQKRKSHYVKEYINCLCSMGDYRAFSAIEAELRLLNRKREKTEAEMSLEHFLWRRKAYMLVETGQFDEAEKLLNGMLEIPENKSFAESELDYLKTLR